MVKTIDLRAHPMRQICDAWLAKIKLALEVRHEKFGKYAEEVSRFYDGPHDFMWDSVFSSRRAGFSTRKGLRVCRRSASRSTTSSRPWHCSARPCATKTRTCWSPLMPAEIAPEALGIDPNDPTGCRNIKMLAGRGAADAHQGSLRVGQDAVHQLGAARDDKKTAIPPAITEAIVTGLGYLETDIFHAPPSSNIVMPRSTYVSWWDVVVDPDASYWEDVQWIAIRRVQPVNLTERRFGLEEGELKGHMQSFEAQSTARGRKEAKQNRKGKSFDLIEYWEVYSKNGFGDRLAEAQHPKQQKYDYSCWATTAGCAWRTRYSLPAQLPDDSVRSMQSRRCRSMFDRVQWPIPFWYDRTAGPSRD
jgi:hypothetical protein